jgi:hypothetical protein
MFLKFPQNLFNNNFVRLAGEFKWSKLVLKASIYDFARTRSFSSGPQKRMLFLFCLHDKLVHVCSLGVLVS